ncbi:hypothetical protein Tco_0483333 [Tanacetum coccineum]
MVKSEETNRQHADHIEKLRAKERQQVFIISEQAQAISKQAETLSKQGETLSKQAEMISFLTRKLLEKNSPQENQSQSSQQAFSQLQQQMQLIQLSNPSLMPQQNIQGARLQAVVVEDEPVEGVVGSESAGQTSSNSHGGASNGGGSDGYERDNNGGGTCEPGSKC